MRDWRHLGLALPPQAGNPAAGPPEQQVVPAPPEEPPEGAILRRERVFLHNESDVL